VFFSSQYGRGGWFHGYSFTCQPVDYSFDEMAVRVSFSFEMNDSFLFPPSTKSSKLLVPHYLVKLCRFGQEIVAFTIWKLTKNKNKQNKTRKRPNPPPHPHWKHSIPLTLLHFVPWLSFLSIIFIFHFSWFSDVV